MRQPNFKGNCDWFYSTMQDRVSYYQAKLIEFEDHEYLQRYYEGRLDATTFLMQQFEIMFDDVAEPQTTEK